MSKLTAARACALSLVSERRRRQGRIRDIMRASTELAALSARDRALASRLCFGAVAYKLTLDELIARYLKRSQKLEPRLKDALRVAAFECVYLETEPAACVSQGVELVRSVAPHAASLANAVLHRLVENERPRYKELNLRIEQSVSLETLSCEELSFLSGLPAWLVVRLQEHSDASTLARLALSARDAAPSYLCINQAHPASHGFKNTVHSVCGENPLFQNHEKASYIASIEQQLHDTGLTFEHTDFEGCLRLASTASLASSEPLTTNKLIISDYMPQLFVRLLLALARRESADTPAPPGPSVSTPTHGESTDVCAARKTTQMPPVAHANLRILEIGQGRATKSLLFAQDEHVQIVGVDNVSSKVELARKRVASAGLEGRVSCVCVNACTLSAQKLVSLCTQEVSSVGSEASSALTSFANSGTTRFEVVFVDAPCSGTGTFRRHPEIAAQLQPEAINQLTNLQAQLLHNASQFVAPGGLFAWSTCSLLPEENERQVQTFLASEEGQAFQLVSLGDALVELEPMLARACEPYLYQISYLQSIPAPDKPDGHFLALLRKIV